MTRTRDRQPCTATTRQGQPCQRKAILGATVCVSHGGMLPTTQDAARLRIAALVMPSLARLAALVEEADSDSVRLAAARDLLDRAGYKPVDKQQQSGSVTVELIHSRPDDLT